MRISAPFVFLLVALAIASAVPAGAQSRDANIARLETLVRQMSELARRRDFAGAIPVTEQALVVAERLFGDEHQNVAALLNNLAVFYQNEGRLSDAGPLLKRSLAIDEKRLGPNDPAIGTTLNNLADLYRVQHRYTEAERFFKRALSIREGNAGRDDPGVGEVLGNMAKMFDELGRNAEAEQAFARALSNIEKGRGSDHPDVATTLNNLALHYESVGRPVDAERHLKRVIAIYEAKFNPDHPWVAIALDNLARLYTRTGRLAEADPLALRALAIREKTLNPNHPALAASLERLASIYHRTRSAEAEKLFMRSLAIKERTFGKDSSQVADTLNHLANMYQGRGRFDMAAEFYQRSLTIREKVDGRESHAVAQSLNNIAYLRKQTNRLAEAQALYERSLAIDEKIVGPTGSGIGMQLSNLGELHFMRQEWRSSARFWERSTALLVQQTRRESASELGNQVAGKTERETQRNRFQFEGLIRALYRVRAAAPGSDRKFVEDTFLNAQWAQRSDVATSVAQMAARTAKGDTVLARLVRERQDLTAEWQGKDALLVAALAQPAASRDLVREKQITDQLSVIDIRIAAIDVALKDKFPDYTALASPEPLSIPDLQKVLRVDEALVLTLDTDELRPVVEETFIWVVTKTEARWIRSDLGTKGLAARVRAMRATLDGDVLATGRAPPAFDVAAATNCIGHCLARWLI